LRCGCGVWVSSFFHAGTDLFYLPYALAATATRYAYALHGVFSA